MRGERAIEAIVHVVERIEGPQRVLLESSVEVRLHHSLNSHASGRRSIVGGSTNDADELPAARVAVVAQHGSRCYALYRLQNAFHQLT
eukprot:5543812-Pleurochrysis_carterae.AAC.1